MMNERELQQLSKDVAFKYGIDAYTQDVSECGDSMPELWLHQDSARCFYLMVEHYLMILNHGCGDIQVIYGYSAGDFVNIYMEDFNNKKHLATRVAILKALLAKD